jgi:hypothetical protein
MTLARHFCFRAKSSLSVAADLSSFKHAPRLEGNTSVKDPAFVLVSIYPVGPIAGPRATGMRAGIAGLSLAHPIVTALARK